MFEQKARFLEAPSSGLSMTAAAREAGLARRNLYGLRKRNHAFGEAWHLPPCERAVAAPYCVAPAAYDLDRHREASG